MNSKFKVFGLFVQAHPDVQANHGFIYALPTGELLFKDVHGKLHPASLRQRSDKADWQIEALDLAVTFTLVGMDTKGGSDGIIWGLQKGDQPCGNLLSDELPNWLNGR